MQRDRAELVKASARETSRPDLPLASLSLSVADLEELKIVVLLPQLDEIGLVRDLAHLDGRGVVMRVSRVKLITAHHRVRDQGVLALFVEEQLLLVVDGDKLCVFEVIQGREAILIAIVTNAGRAVGSERADLIEAAWQREYVQLTERIFMAVPVQLQVDLAPVDAIKAILAFELFNGGGKAFLRRRHPLQVSVLARMEGHKLLLCDLAFGRLDRSGHPLDEPGVFEGEVTLAVYQCHSEEKVFCVGVEWLVVTAIGVGGAERIVDDVGARADLILLEQALQSEHSDAQDQHEDDESGASPGAGGDARLATQVEGVDWHSENVRALQRPWDLGKTRPAHWHSSHF